MLETERLLLLPCSENDLRVGSRSLARLALQKNLSFDPAEADDKRLQKRIYKAKAGLIREMPDGWLLCTAWLIVRKDEHRLIGDLGFKGVPHMGEVEIGYGLLRPYRNSGYMSEAVDALCRFAFSQTDLPVSCILATTLPNNTASHRVLQKNHFVRDGTMGNLFCWRRRSIHSDISIQKTDNFRGENEQPQRSGKRFWELLKDFFSDNY